MFIPKMSTDALDEGKWYMMVVEGKTPPRRTGYCAGSCSGHSTEAEASEHFLQYQLDREVDLWLARRGERAGERGCDRGVQVRQGRPAAGSLEGLSQRSGRQHSSSQQIAIRFHVQCSNTVKRGYGSILDWRRVKMCQKQGRVLLRIANYPGVSISGR